jgi:RecJ-like exonuclease
VLLDELHRRHVSEDEREHDGDESPPIVTVGFGEDELRYRSTHPIDDRAVAAAARESSNGESLSVRGGSDARFEFLVGEREAVSEALLGAIAAGLSE